MRVLVVSEGLLDVAEGDGSADFKGAVGVLVRRLLEAKLGRAVKEWEIEGAHLPRVHAQSEEVSGYERKVRLAIVEAATRGCTAVVIVVDRDRTEGVTRLSRLREGRASAERMGQPLAYRTALGVAIESVEAWLLADENALREALELKLPAALTDPEKLDGKPNTATNPKHIFEEMIKKAGRDKRASYETVAELVRLDLLEQRCRAGFAPFAEEVRARCA